MSTGFRLNKIYHAGYCLGRGAFADKTLGWNKVRFHTRCFLLEHPKRGLFLIDTGYGKALLEATQGGIYSLYRTLLPVIYHPEDSIVSQLSRDGISLKDLSYLIITHFHPDHIGALPEFTTIPWIYRKDTLDYLIKLSAFKGLQKGFIRPLMPPIPKKSISIMENCFMENWYGFASFDLFGDGSLYLINLPGHAMGQMGIAIQDLFFIADAKWGTDALPHKIGLLLQENPKIYRKTFESLQKLPSSIQLFPTHIIEAHA
ncbi:MAG: MBL fold metallo-hydrolase [Candidatus Rhabdochlamydia sp.]